MVNTSRVHHIVVFFGGFFFLIFLNTNIYFTMIDTQVLQLILMSFVEEAGVPGENPRFQVGDHHTRSHTTTVYHSGRSGDKREHSPLRYLDTNHFVDKTNTLFLCITISGKPIWSA